MQVILKNKATLPGIDSGLDFAEMSPTSVGSELSLSFESQLQLKSLRRYLDQSRSALGEIQADLDRFEIDPGDHDLLPSITKRLGRFCMDADSWGFNSLYETAFRLQCLFLKSGCGVWSNQLWKSVKRSLSMLCYLLDQCESDFRSRMVANEQR